METVQFKTRIKDDSIQIPAKYRGKFKDSMRVQVIIVSKDEKRSAADIIDELMSHPLKVKRFKPLTRDEAHARK